MFFKDHSFLTLTEFNLAYEQGQVPPIITHSKVNKNKKSITSSSPLEKPFNELIVLFSYYCILLLLSEPSSSKEKSSFTVPTSAKTHTLFNPLPLLHCEITEWAAPQVIMSRESSLYKCYHPCFRREDWGAGPGGGGACVVDGQRLGSPLTTFSWCSESCFLLVSSNVFVLLSK